MSFYVNKLLATLSDHCSIEVKLRTKFIAKIFNVNNHEFLQKPSKIKWDKDIAVKFENLLQLPNSKLFINNFAKNGIYNEQNCIDSATEFLSGFITNTAETAGLNANQIEFNCPKRNPQPNWKFKKKKTRKKVMPKWHDATCESVLKQRNLSSNLLKK